MDVGDLMKFKPPTAPKRPVGGDQDEHELEEEDDPNASYEQRAAKRRKKQKLEQKRREQERLAMLEAEASNILANKSNGGDIERANELSELVDKVDAEASGKAILDETELKRLILNFEKKSLRNQELRVKYPDDPTKFMQSEVELHDSIQELRDLATAPDLYPILVDLKSIQTFVGLLSHENTDIAVAMVDLIQELTDVDTLNESEEGAESLVRALVENQISALLVQNLERLNDTIRVESDGIHNTLAVFENLIEFKPEICKEAADAGFLNWLIKKLKVKVPFDSNKLYASEMLSIFLQNEPDNRKKFGEMGAIDSLLQQLAYYKRHNPASAEEQELMENLFDCLCSLLLHTPNRDRFLRGEGLQLMNLMLREKKVSRNGALKVLDHALIGPEGKDNCAKFIDILGLRTIFPLFMKTPKKQKRKGVSAEQHEEHVVSIVASLMKNSRGTQRQRLFAKFTESNHEKVERIMELHFKYQEKVSIADNRIEESEDMDEDEAYLERLDHGLFTLQLIDYVIAEICACGEASIKELVLKILNQRNVSVSSIRSILREYAGNIGEGENDEGEKFEEKQRILALVDKL